MQLKRYIDLLNEHGYLGPTILMRKFKLEWREAKQILKEIIERFENVYAITEHGICIEGREPDHLRSKIKEPKLKKIKEKYISILPPFKKSKWKDITKP